MTGGILDHGFISVDDIPEGVDLVAAIRDLNARHLDVPWMWSIELDTAGIADPDGISFGVGVRGETGALHWATNRGDNLVPANGTNADAARYRLAGLHDSYLPAGAEVPVATVYAALSEFLATRRLPTCVRWRPADG